MKDDVFPADDYYAEFSCLKDNCRQMLGYLSYETNTKY